MKRERYVEFVVPEFRMEPCGLRECVLRLDAMLPSRADSYARVQKDTLMSKVARWRLEDPESFRQLLGLVRGGK